MKMELVCVTDTRGQPPKVIMMGNILLHCGNCTANGKYSEMVEFIEWLDRQPHERIIIVPGDNEIGLFSEDNPLRPGVMALLQSSTDIFLLLNRPLVLGDITFIGQGGPDGIDTDNLVVFATNHEDQEMADRIKPDIYIHGDGKRDELQIYKCNRINEAWSITHHSMSFLNKCMYCAGPVHINDTHVMTNAGVMCAPCHWNHFD